LIATIHAPGRLLIEEGSARAYGGFFLPALLPSQTHVEQIGGPYPQVPLIHHRTTFDENNLLGRPLAEWTPGAALARLHFLRVRWAVTATESANRFIASLPDVQLRWEDGPLRFWELPRDSGGIPVRADYNRIEAGIAVGSRPVVLPYHWVEGLETDGGNEIVPVLCDDDPVPFVCVRRVAASPVVVRY